MANNQSGQSQHGKSRFDELPTISSVTAKIETKQLLLRSLYSIDLQNLSDPNGQYQRSRQMILSRIESAQQELESLDEMYLDTPKAIEKAERELEELRVKKTIAEHTKQIQRLQELARQVNIA